VTTVVDGVSRCVGRAALAAAAGDVDEYVRWANGALGLVDTLINLGEIERGDAEGVVASLVEVGAGLGLVLRAHSADADRPDDPILDPVEWLSALNASRKPAVEPPIRPATDTKPGG
jgi:hypothetical protein